MVKVYRILTPSFTTSVSAEISLLSSLKIVSSLFKNGYGVFADHSRYSLLLKFLIILIAEYQ